MEEPLVQKCSQRRVLQLWYYFSLCFCIFSPPPPPPDPPSLEYDGEGLGGCAERNPPPNRDGVLNSLPGLPVLTSDFFYNFFTSTFWESERSAYPSLILPRRPAHSARRTKIYEGWRVLASLGRKNRVPRGLQKRIKF